MKNLPRGVYTFFDASTGHITQKDDELIKNCEFPLSAYEYECGYFIFSGVTSTDEAEVDRLREFGMSEAFIRIWKRAAELDCWYLRLDCDGIFHDDFETFDW